MGLNEWEGCHFQFMISLFREMNDKVKLILIYIEINIINQIFVMKISYFIVYDIMYDYNILFSIYKVNLTHI